MEIGVADATIEYIDLDIAGTHIAAGKFKWSQGRFSRIGRIPGYLACYLAHEHLPR